MYFLNILILCLVASALGNDDYVLEFGDRNFNSRIREHDFAFVMFYAPWCSHCKRVQPEFAKAAEELIWNEPPVTLIKVDCVEAGKETCDKYSVDGYPKLKFFRYGNYYEDYKGEREADDLIKYIQAQAILPFKKLNSVGDLEKFLSSKNKSVLVGFFEKPSELQAVFLRQAEESRKTIDFAYSSTKELLDTQGVNDGVLLFRPAHLKNKFEADIISYQGDANTKGLNDFITTNLYGLTGIRDSHNKHEFKNPYVVGYYNIDYIKNPKGTNYWRNRILKVAKEYNHEITFAISPTDEFTTELKEFGIEITQPEKPTITARDVKNKRYVMKQEFSSEALKTFVDDLLAGNLEPVIKSEPIPDSQDGPVTIAVAKNFNEVVVNNDKDTLIKFYAPWCDHCKKLAPAYDELGEKLKGEDIAIVKMDATANDVPAPYKVQGFPTLYWAAKDKKDDPVMYEGGGDVKEFIEYIAKEATDELKKWDRNGNIKTDRNEL